MCCRSAHGQGIGTISGRWHQATFASGGQRKDLRGTGSRRKRGRERQGGKKKENRGWLPKMITKTMRTSVRRLHAPRSSRGEGERTGDERAGRGACALAGSLAPNARARGRLPDGSLGAGDRHTPDRSPCTCGRHVLDHSVCVNGETGLGGQSMHPVEAGKGSKRGGRIGAPERRASGGLPTLAKGVVVEKGLRARRQRGLRERDHEDGWRTEGNVEKAGNIRTGGGLPACERATAETSGKRNRGGRKERARVSRSEAKAGASRPRAALEKGKIFYGAEESVGLRGTEWGTRTERRSALAAAQSHQRPTKTETKAKMETSATVATTTTTTKKKRMGTGGRGVRQGQPMQGRRGPGEPGDAERGSEDGREKERGREKKAHGGDR